MKKVFLFVGRTNSGKTSVASKVADELNLNIVSSYTTRPMRANETDHVDHIFIDTEDVSSYAEDMVAYTEINGNEYFCTIDQLRVCEVYTIDPDGIEYMERKLELKNNTEFEFIVIYIYASQNTRWDRASNRQDDLEVYGTRNYNENWQFSLFEEAFRYDYCIVNKDFNKTVEIVKSIINVENGVG